MSDHHAGAPGAGGRRRARRRRSGCLPMLVVLAVIAAGGYFLVRTIDLQNPFASDAPDFSGPGTGTTVFTVSGGDSISVQARNLENLGVVKSDDAYIEAAEADDAAGRIREGVYRVKKQMKAADVVTLLAGGTTRGSSFTFTSGKTVEEVVDLLVEDTDVGRKQYLAAIAKPASIGLPTDVAGTPGEGYLAPGSYTFFPDDDATTVLSAMVARSLETFDEVGLAAAAERLGYTQQQLLTVASLVEAEGSLLDERGKAKIARVIYNRLADPSVTGGLLQLDATVNYALGEKIPKPTFAQLDQAADSPYSTYANPGLPPGPIATPSRDALVAATKPADGPWFFYATVNLETGETKFAETAEQFAAIDAELDRYCDQNPRRCGR